MFPFLAKIALTCIASKVLVERDLNVNSCKMLFLKAPLGPCLSGSTLYEGVQDRTCNWALHAKPLNYLFTGVIACTPLIILFWAIYQDNPHSHTSPFSKWAASPRLIANCLCAKVMLLG